MYNKIRRPPHYGGSTASMPSTESENSSCNAYCDNSTYMYCSRTSTSCPSYFFPPQRQPWKSKGIYARDVSQTPVHSDLGISRLTRSRICFRECPVHSVQSYFSYFRWNFRKIVAESRGDPCRERKYKRIVEKFSIPSDSCNFDMQNHREQNVCALKISEVCMRIRPEKHSKCAFFTSQCFCAALRWLA